ncbi:MAG: CAP domain-containing protein [Flavobacteriales bacterium]|nr:CAP domain-containing protein [Flavobacteriales bacterium]MCX7768646.1 CAP domain-containing protein [Flavobacteriales bacterium]MDW8410364.1 CAP domain-containing protein [Flavobacteriales bacterium]
MKFRFFGLIWLIALSWNGKSRAQKVELLKEEALRAIKYLNQLRQNPADFSDSLGVNLKDASAAVALSVDPVLTQVAEERAIDMARRNYFSHTTPEGKTVNSILCAKGYPIPKDLCQFKTINNFESICAGSNNGIECINFLVKDEGLDPPGHRIHLLGMNEFYRQHRKVGAALAFCPNSDYEYYFVIITAP